MRKSIKKTMILSLISFMISSCNIANLVSNVTNDSKNLSNLDCYSQRDKYLKENLFCQKERLEEFKKSYSEKKAEEMARLSYPFTPPDCYK